MSGRLLSGKLMWGAQLKEAVKMLNCIKKNMSTQRVFVCVIIVEFLATPAIDNAY